MGMKKARGQRAEGRAASGAATGKAAWVNKKIWISPDFNHKKD
jgi:hypothetical protein